MRRGSGQISAMAHLYIYIYMHVGPLGSIWRAALASFKMFTMFSKPFKNLKNLNLKTSTSTLPRGPKGQGQTLAILLVMLADLFRVLRF